MFASKSTSKQNPRREQKREKRGGKEQIQIHETVQLKKHCVLIETEMAKTREIIYNYTLTFLRKPVLSSRVFEEEPCTGVTCRKCRPTRLLASNLPESYTCVNQGMKEVTLVLEYTLIDEVDCKNNTLASTKFSTLQ
jgi:hypothetical protein